MTAAARAALMIPLLIAAMMLPVAARAHSTDFILVKASPRAGGIDVELTADYGGNPMFTGVDDARGVLTKVLRVHAGGQSWDLGVLVPLRFEERTRFDPTAPIPLDPPGSAEAHRLLCAKWSWNCRAEAVTFEMPAEAGQSVILWEPPAAADQQPRWVFLLPGESSPVIPIPAPRFPSWLFASLSVGVVGVSTGLCYRFAAKEPVID